MAPVVTPKKRTSQRHATLRALFASLRSSETTLGVHCVLLVPAKLAEALAALAEAPAALAEGHGEDCKNERLGRT